MTWVGKRTVKYFSTCAIEMAIWSPKVKPMGKLEGVQKRFVNSHVFKLRWYTTALSMWSCVPTLSWRLSNFIVGQPTFSSSNRLYLRFPNLFTVEAFFHTTFIFALRSVDCAIDNFLLRTIFFINSLTFLGVVDFNIPSFKCVIMNLWAISFLNCHTIL